MLSSPSGLDLPSLVDCTTVEEQLLRLHDVIMHCFGLLAFLAMQALTIELAA